MKNAGAARDRARCSGFNAGIRRHDDDGARVAPPRFLKERDARFEAQPMASLTQALKLRHGGVERVARRGMAWARRHEHSPFTQTYERLRHDQRWEVQAMDGGHHLMGELPDETAAFLLRFA